MGAFAHIMPWVRVFRVHNLMIVALIQGIVYHKYAVPLLHSLGYNRSAPSPVLGLFILVSLIVVASGNLINDIFDQNIDAINKPNLRQVGRTISEKTAIMVYAGLILTGAVIALYLAHLQDEWKWFFLYPLSVGLLFGYSKKLKCKPLVGNLLIALMSSVVIGLPLLLESKILTTGVGHQPPVLSKFAILGMWMWLAFLISLAREWAKDAEDLIGDTEYGCGTLAVRMGLGRLRWLIIGILLLAILSELTWIWWNGDQFTFSYCAFFFILPQAIISVVLFRHFGQETYRKVSFQLKVMMFFALLYLILAP